MKFLILLFLLSCTSLPDSVVKERSLESKVQRILDSKSEDLKKCAIRWEVFDSKKRVKLKVSMELDSKGLIRSFQVLPPYGHQFSRCCFQAIDLEAFPKSEAGLVTHKSFTLSER